MSTRAARCLVGASLVILLSAGTQPTRLNSSRVGWVPVPAQTTRSFYRAEEWLTTSPETQTLMVTGILRAYEQVAEAVEARGPAGEGPSIREREALRLLECVRVSPGLTMEEVRQAVHAYAAAHPTDIFSTVGDLAGRALDRRCPLPPAH